MKFYYNLTFVIFCAAISHLPGTHAIALLTNLWGTVTALTQFRIEGIFSVNPWTTLTNLNCIIRFAFLSGHVLLFDNFDLFFRDDSEFTLAQAGTYRGVQDIYEYDSFMIAERSKYWATGPTTLGQSFLLYGVNDGVCEMTGAFASNYEVDPSATGSNAKVDIVTMVHYFLDMNENYVKKANVFFPSQFFEYFFGTIAASSVTQEFICDQVLGEICDGIVPEQTDCINRLAALPKLEGSESYFDGKTMGCRVLHAAFALNNPEGHCAHVTLDPTPDPSGSIKCQTTESIAIDSLISDADMDFFKRFADRIGIDADVGYNIV